MVSSAALTIRILIANPYRPTDVGAQLTRMMLHVPDVVDMQFTA
jgi:hypothetical protein